MRQTFYGNGRDLYTNFGLSVRRFEGWFAQFKVLAPSVPILGRVGSMRTSAYASALQSRQFTVVGNFVATDSDTLRRNVEAFFAWMQLGALHELSISWYPGKVFYGTLVESDFLPGDPQFLANKTAEGRMTFQIDSPLLYDAAPVEYFGKAGDFVTPRLGNFPSAPTVRLIGAKTNPTYTLYSGALRTLSSVGVTSSLTSNQFLTINHDDLSCTLTNAAGVESDVPSALPTGDPFFLLDPLDGDPANDAFPYVSADCDFTVSLVRLYVA